MPFCTNCGKELKKEAKFCVGCGISTIAKTSKNEPAIKSESIVKTDSDIEKIPGKLSDKWAWAMAGVSVLGAGAIATNSLGYNGWIWSIMFFIFNTVFWLLDLREIKKKGYYLGEGWLGIFTKVAPFLAPVYLFIRAAKTTKEYSYAFMWCILFMWGILFVVATAVLTSLISGYMEAEREYLEAGKSSASTDNRKGTDGFATQQNNAIPSTQIQPANTFTDSRDGKIYRTATIGGHVWMAENLNFQPANGSWCYDNNSVNCNTYGRLYTWNIAMNACPVGWRLPTRQDWNNLVVAAGANPGAKFKSRPPTWNGTDDFGFSALPGGYRFGDGRFGHIGLFGGWWTATDSSAANAYYRGVNSDRGDVREWANDKNRGFSIRCIQGAPPTGSLSSVPTVNQNNRFTDPRDGKTYRIAKIGNLTWLAENLNYQTHDSWCNNNNSANCNRYGRLYTWDAAMRACPAGWRLPTDADWNDLVQAVGGRKILTEDYHYVWDGAGRTLKSRSGWNNRGNGTDDFGFSALPGGRRWYGGDFYGGGDSIGIWWTATATSGEYASIREMHSRSRGVYEGDDLPGSAKHNGYSVRCVQGAPNEQRESAFGDRFIEGFIGEKFLGEQLIEGLFDAVTGRRTIEEQIEDRILRGIIKGLLD